MNENTIESMYVLDFKKIVKISVRNAAFEELEALKESHNKVKHNTYINMNNTQGYIKPGFSTWQTSSSEWNFF